MSAPYFVLKIFDVPVELIDRLTGELFEFGATGVQEDLPFKQEGEFYEVTELPRTHALVVAYFSESPTPEALGLIQSLGPGLRFELLREEPKDWLAEWKKGYLPFELVNGVFVVPSWLTAPKEARISLKIDPGMAFGTGTHETTQLAAGLIAQIPAPGRVSVLDVGTGTGILGFLAEVLGSQKIVGLEIDPEARRTARENAQSNHSKMTVPEHQIEQHFETYNLVIANIIDGVLVQLQNHLKRCLAPSGFLILTGILEDRDPGFRERFDFAGFKLIERQQKSEWIGYLLQRLS